MSPMFLGAQMSVNFPRYHVRTDRPGDLNLVRLAFALTEGLVGRGYRFSMRCLKPAFGDRMAKAIFEDGSQFVFPLADPYWNRLAAAAFSYEPEISIALKRVRDIDYTFIDAGANFGFWSVLASAPDFGAKRTLAVEASADTFQILDRNRELNGRRFETFRNAVFDKDGVELGFSAGGHHTARQLTQESGRERVQTITLDTLAQRASIDRGTPIVLKLDVEGADQAALEGAGQLLQHDLMIVYEEHGQDSTHAMTRFIRNELQFDAVYLDDDGAVTLVSDPDQLGLIKKNPHKGYNLFAWRRGSVFQKPIMRT